MSQDSVITKLQFDEVVVPAHPGAIGADDISKPLHKLPVGGRAGWSAQFDELPKLLLRLHLANGIVGFGEFYRDHNWDIVEAMSHILLGRRLTDLTLQDLPISRTREYDGFECAIWDAYARWRHIRLVDLLGGPMRTRIRVSAWSSHRGPAEMGIVARRFQNAGYDTLKLKTDLEDPIVEVCREVREQAPGLRLILDSNERWKNAASVRPLLRPLEEVENVLLLEDPLPRWMLDEFRDLRRFTSIPIVLHVSIPYAQQGQGVQDTVNALTHHAVDGFNLNAGIDTFLQMDRVTAAAGLFCWHGSEIDLGILEAMYVHTAAAAKSCVWPSDIFGRAIRQHDLLREPLHFTPPYVGLPEGPGLGVELDLDAVECFKTGEKVFSL